MNRQVEPQGRRVSSNAGFTLLEMMIVVAIIGIAAALAAPNYGEWVSRYALRQAVADMTNQMTLGRMTAMNRNVTVTMTMALAGGRLTVTGTDPAGGVILSSSQEGIHLTALNPVAPLVAPSISFSSIGLRSGGGAVDQVVQVTNDRGVVYSMRVTPGGKADWCPRSTCP